MHQEGSLLRAECECRKWRLDVLEQTDPDVVQLVAHAMAEDEKHLDQLDRQRLNGNEGSG
jgi:hypothetical protein